MKNFKRRVCFSISVLLAGIFCGKAFGGESYDAKLIPIDNTFNCGPVAAYLFLVAAGKSVAFQEVRNQFKGETKLSSFQDIILALEHYDVATKGVACDLNNLKNRGAFIALLEGDSESAFFHFVLAKYDGKKVKVVDLKQSESIISIDPNEFQARFKNRAIIYR